jgi:lysophospholipase L1-like esterase
LAGLLAREYPQLLIDNRGRDGALLADVVSQLATDDRFDVVLVLAGGNDVIRLRSRDAMRADIERVANAAAARAPLVVLMPSGNVGNAPFFFLPLSWLMTSRSRALHDFVADSATRSGFIYVDLFRERANDPFVADPSLNASDGLHPSDAGYRNWWGELQKQAALARHLAAAKAT